MTGTAPSESPERHQSLVAAQETLIVGEPDKPLVGLHEGSMAAWFAENVPGAKAPLKFALIAAGGSNLTFKVANADGSQWVLRRPPVGPLLGSAHDVMREFAILNALADSPIPVPRCVAGTGSTDVCGAPFFVMDYSEGWIIRDRGTAVTIGPEACRQAANSFFETLAALHALDPSEAGLDDLRRNGSYVERQLRRWRRQYEQVSRGSTDPLFAEIHDRLEQGQSMLPPATQPRLLHGDYHIDNAIFDGDFRVKALLDWELSALGDPLADLAWALMFWPEPGDEFSALADPITTAPGFPGRAEVTSTYGRASGADLSLLPYFRSFTYWKFGCLTKAAEYRSFTGSGGGLQQSQTLRHNGPSRTEALFAAAAEAATEAGI